MQTPDEKRHSHHRTCIWHPDINKGTKDWGGGGYEAGLVVVLLLDRTTKSSGRHDKKTVPLFV